MKSYVLSLLFALLATMIVSYSFAGYAVASLDAAPPPDAALVESGSGSGSAAVVLPDPYEQPAEAASLLSSLLKSGAIPSLLIVGLYFVALLASRWVSWLRGSRRRAAITGATLALLATLAERAHAGTTPTLSMILAGAATAIALFVKLDGDEQPQASAE